MKSFHSLARTLIWAALALSAAASTAGASDPFGQVLNGPAALTAISDADGTLSAGGCHDEPCRAVHDLDDAFLIIARRDHPNPMSMLHPEAFKPWVYEWEHNVQLRRLLRAGRHRWRLYCEVLGKLAAHFSELQVGYIAVELAGRISGPGLDCAVRVVSAFPHTRAAADMLRDASQLCTNLRQPGCGYIDRALATRGEFSAR